MSNTKEKLKAKVTNAEQNADIAALYILEESAHEHFDEESLYTFYASILDLALERLTETLEAHRVMDINEVQDFATLRALYEYAIEHYSTEKHQDASALFEVLSGLSNDKKFSLALKFHWLASAENISFDDFLQNIADMDATQNAGTFYISCFTQKAQNLLDSAEEKEK